MGLAILKNALNATFTLPSNIQNINDKKFKQS